jgi:hypothetical protein
VQEGWVNKDEMLDIQGRTRQRQLELAEKLGVEVFPNAGGGCLLTDSSFSKRLRDLVEHNTLENSEIHLLKYGRHFRINDEVKLLVGRTMQDNEGLSKYAGERIVLKAKNVKGPLGIISCNNQPNDEILKLACSIFLNYCNKAETEDVVLYGKNFELENEISVCKMKPADYEQYWIK